MKNIIISIIFICTSIAFSYNSISDPNDYNDSILIYENNIEPEYYTHDYSEYTHINYNHEVYKVYKLIEYYRNKYKAGRKLEINKNLQEMAMTRAKELSEKYSHTRPDGREFYTVTEDFDMSDYWNSIGENIAYGYKDAKEVMKAWMESVGHRRNILYEKYTSVGVGLYVKNGTAYWVQIFCTDNPKYKENNTEYHKKDNKYDTHYNSTDDSYKNYDEYGDNDKNDSLY